MVRIADWWKPDGGFFNREIYQRGDKSVTGYIPGKAETLQERTEREVDGSLGLLELAPGKKMLDIPCGYSGRHSIGFAQRGYVVTGVDINPDYIDQARARAAEAGVDVNFQIGNMRDLRRFREEFDGLGNMFLSFGFLTERDNFETMKQFYNSLRTGGRLLLHTDATPEIVNGGKYKKDEERDLVGGGKLRIHETFNRLSKRLVGTWTIVENNNSAPTEKTGFYTVRIYSKDELEEMATKGAGFRDAQFYGSFDKEEFSPESTELIMVATR